MTFNTKFAFASATRKTFKTWVTAAAISIAATGAAHAIDITPNLAQAPTGWTTDRYQPDSFGNVGSFAGRTDVLGIGISPAQGAANRPIPGNPGTSYLSGQFYNTQGMIKDVVGGIGSTISADLYIDRTWGKASNGNVRSDLWGITTDGTRTSPTDSGAHRKQLPIIGFSNFGGSSRLRAWDGIGAFVDLSIAVNYDAWTTLSMTYTGSAIQYAVNGINVYSFNTDAGTVGFSDIILQAYNFNDTSLTGAVDGSYTAHWTNTAPVPEPETYALMAMGLLAVAATARKRKRKSA